MGNEGNNYDSHESVNFVRKMVMKPHNTLLARANGFKKHGLGLEQLKLLLDDMPISIMVSIIVGNLQGHQVLVLNMNSTRIRLAYLL